MAPIPYSTEFLFFYSGETLILSAPYREKAVYSVKRSGSTPLHRIALKSLFWQVLVFIPLISPLPKKVRRVQLVRGLGAGYLRVQDAPCSRLTGRAGHQPCIYDHASLAQRRRQRPRHAVEWWQAPADRLDSAGNLTTNDAPLMYTSPSRILSSELRVVRLHGRSQPPPLSISYPPSRPHPPHSVYLHLYQWQ